MAVRTGDRLPADVVRAFDGQRLEEQVGIAYPLVTVDAAGPPRLSMLSAGELWCPSERAVRIAMWPSTRTGANLASGREALLCVVRPGSVLYVRGAAKRLAVPAGATSAGSTSAGARSAGTTSAGVALECFELTVTSVESDSHEGMPVATPITFDTVNPNRQEVLKLWRKQLSVLESAAPP